jgi:thioredoxin reductase
VSWFGSSVSQVGGSAESSFELQAGAHTLQARRIILAMGVVDELPAIPGLQERWGRSVFHCPYCHGYELDRGRIGVIATGPASLHHATLVPEWGEVTFFLNGAVEPSQDELRAIAARGVEVEATCIAAIEEHACVVLHDGRRKPFAGLFAASRTSPSSALAEQLGCVHESGPLGSYVKTGAHEGNIRAGRLRVRRPGASGGQRGAGGGRWGRRRDSGASVAGGSRAR